MQREEMIEYSDQIAILQIEEELRQDEKKAKVLCDHCGKAVASEELFEFREARVCGQCLLLLRIKFERERE